jgi:hypothetical protein
MTIIMMPDFIGAGLRCPAQARAAAATPPAQVRLDLVTLELAGMRGTTYRGNTQRALIQVGIAWAEVGLRSGAAALRIFETAPPSVAVRSVDAPGTAIGWLLDRFRADGCEHYFDSAVMHTRPDKRLGHKSITGDSRIG